MEIASLIISALSLILNIMMLVVNIMMLVKVNDILKNHINNNGDNNKNAIQMVRGKDNETSLSQF